MERNEEGRQREGLRSRVEVAAAEALRQFPSERKCAKIPDRETRELLSRLRLLVERGTRAMELRGEDFRQWCVQIDALRLGFSAGEYVTQRMRDNGGGSGGSCTRQCKQERDGCIRSDCGPETSWPCFCCAPCNATWMACLADCIFSDDYRDGGVILA
jgi:hypothetical protein